MIRNKIIVGILMILMACSVTAHADSPTLTLNKLKQGDGYKITVLITEDSSVCVGSIEIKTDGNFVIDNIACGEVLEGAMFESNKDYKENISKVSFMTLEPVTKQGEMFVFSITPRDKNSGGTIELVNIKLSDADENKIQVNSDKIIIEGTLQSDAENEKPPTTHHSTSSGGGSYIPKEKNPDVNIDITFPIEVEEKEIKFTDIENVSWAKDQISFLAKKGVINGVSENAFAPNENIKRGDFICLLVRMLKLNQDVTENFADVKEDEYWYKEIGIAKSLNIANGFDDGFHPKDNITRQDMFSLVARACNFTSSGMKCDYKDFDLISDYAKESIMAMTELGYIQGSDGYVNPKNNATRAETAVMLYNIYNNIYREEK